MNDSFRTTGSSVPEIRTPLKGGYGQVRIRTQTYLGTLGYGRVRTFVDEVVVWLDGPKSPAERIWEFDRRLHLLGRLLDSRIIGGQMYDTLVLASLEEVSW